MTDAPRGRTAARVLIVCHANVARSVMAARLLEGAAAEHGVHVEIRTAGTHATDGQPASLRTQRALEAARAGTAPVGSHRARLLRDDDVRWADVIVAMEASQVRYVRRAFPEAASRTATIGVLASALVGAGPLADRLARLDLATWEMDSADDVADPAGGEEADYALAARDLRDLCERLAVRLAG